MDWSKLKEQLIDSKYHYFHTTNGVLLCGDCLEIMKDFPKESIDLVLTDPPYNIANNTKLTKVGNKVKSTHNAWGNKFKDCWQNKDNYFEWITSIIKVLENKIIVNGSIISFFDRNYTGYIVYLIEKHTSLKFRNKIYFEKNNPLPHIRKNNYRSCIEESVWFSKEKYKINFINQKEMKQIFKGNIGRKQTKHPTEKYQWMIKPLIERHSNENDIVLDPFLGSGTTAVACEKLNRRWIGIEINPDYCEISKKRINTIWKDLI